MADEVANRDDGTIARAASDDVVNDELVEVFEKDPELLSWSRRKFLIRTGYLAVGATLGYDAGPAPCHLTQPGDHVGLHRAPQVRLTGPGPELLGGEGVQKVLQLLHAVVEDEVDHAGS